MPTSSNRLELSGTLSIKTLLSVAGCSMTTLVVFRRFSSGSPSQLSLLQHTTRTTVSYCKKNHHTSKYSILSQSDQHGKSHLFSLGSMSLDLCLATSFAILLALFFCRLLMPGRNSESINSAACMGCDERQVGNIFMTVCRISQINLLHEPTCSGETFHRNLLFRGEVYIKTYRLKYPKHDLDTATEYEEIIVLMSCQIMPMQVCRPDIY